MLDSSTAKTHQHAMGAKGGKEAHAIAKSRGGNGTKIHAIVDALGYPIDILLTGDETK